MWQCCGSSTSLALRPKFVLRTYVGQLTTVMVFSSAKSTINPCFGMWVTTTLKFARPRLWVRWSPGLPLHVYDEWRRLRNARKHLYAWRIRVSQSSNGPTALPGANSQQLTGPRRSKAGRSHHPVQRQCEGAHIALHIRSASILKPGILTAGRSDHRFQHSLCYVEAEHALELEAYFQHCSSDYSRGRFSFTTVLPVHK